MSTNTCQEEELHSHRSLSELQGIHSGSRLSQGFCGETHLLELSLGLQILLP